MRKPRAPLAAVHAPPRRFSAPHTSQPAPGGRALPAFRSWAPPGSGDEVKRIGKLEGPFGHAAFEVGQLIAHVRDDGKAHGRNLLSGRRLEFHQRPEMRAVWREERLLVSDIAGGPQVP